VERSNEEGEEGANDGVDEKQERSGYDREQSDTDESTDSEEDKTVREQLGSARVADSSILVAIVEEEGSDGDLSSDVPKKSA
jgi:hypothetical protein